MATLYDKVYIDLLLHKLHNILYYDVCTCITDNVVGCNAIYCQGTSVRQDYRIPQHSSNCVHT